jgi:rare lipoprotein A
MMPWRAVILCAAVLLVACSGAPLRESPRQPPDPDAVPDAVPHAEPRSARGNPPFYEVFGERYTVLASADGYLERGVASWYGPDFDGGTTSSGERYDMHAMTAAHRTLPLPSYVRVTNLSNGRSVVLRVNDRGPFKSNRIIDVSRTAAAKLDMLRDGTALVEVQSVGPTSQPQAPAVAHGTRFYAQAGAFQEPDNARQLAGRIAAEGFTDVAVVAARSGGRTVHRVRIGPLATVASYDSVVARLRAAGFGPVILAFD